MGPGAPPSPQAAPCVASTMTTTSAESSAGIAAAYQAGISEEAVGAAARYSSWSTVTSSQGSSGRASAAFACT